MGSALFKTLEEQGQEIERGGGETMVAYPEAFAIVGLDISAEDLLALYPDEGKQHTRARAIILGIRDKTRVRKPPDRAFVATFRKGTEEPITLANLGPDHTGHVWIVVAKGRNRTMAQRAWNEANPRATWKILGFLKPFIHNDAAGIDAELEALESNAVSNVFVAEVPSTKADRAVMLAAKNRSNSDIAISIGVRGAQEVIYLLTLAECHDDVKTAVDDGLLTLVQAGDLAKHPHEEQARRVARLRAGPSRAAKNEAAAPREKARPAKYMLALAPKLPDRIYTQKEVQALVLHLGGNPKALDGHPELLAMAKGGEP